MSPHLISLHYAHLPINIRMHQNGLYEDRANWKVSSDAS